MSLIHRIDKLRKIKVVTTLLLIILVNVSCADLLTTKSYVGLIFPVLAPPKNSRARVTETAKDYPVLFLLANKNNNYKDAPRMGEQSEPIYVERLEERINPRHAMLGKRTSLS
ncbi:hypothetical protein RR48_08829 [Papilio machaon]|uniref:Uncharacterized protein n=1 Tax=Papilio machaon TaxID=76193 RepID=A0A194QV19_PAPMA|nr:hypothetical protein RR48_08829 [Papilio machaon]